MSGERLTIAQSNNGRDAACSVRTTTIINVDAARSVPTSKDARAVSELSIMRLCPPLLLSIQFYQSPNNLVSCNKLITFVVSSSPLGL